MRTALALVAAKMAVCLTIIAVLCCGCAQPSTVNHYATIGPVRRIVRVPISRINDVCWGEKWDDGTYRKPGERAEGCWDPDTGTIWITDTSNGAKALPHELCHADGKAHCDEYDW